MTQTDVFYAGIHLLSGCLARVGHKPAPTPPGYILALHVAPAATNPWEDPNRPPQTSPFTTTPPPHPTAAREILQNRRNKRKNDLTGPVALDKWTRGLGGGAGSRTPVRRVLRVEFSERSRRLVVGR